jgi:hypothetical protein
MLSIIFWIFVGIALGWNLPQPSWAKNVQNKVINFIRNIKE